MRSSSVTEQKLLSKDSPTSLLVWLIPISFALFIGYRPIDGFAFVDMKGYNGVYYTLAYGNDFTFNWDASNYLFDNIFNWLGSKRYEITTFFVGSAIIYFVGAYIGYKELFPSNSLIAYIGFLGAFSTFSYGTNGIKAGMAASLFIIAIASYKKPIISTIFLFLSLGFHHSMILPVTAVIIAYAYHNSKIYLLFWFFALVVSLLHIQYFQEILGSMADESGSEYLLDTDDDWGGKTGFRWDFVLYSAIPIITGFYWVVRHNIKDFGFNLIYNTYLLTNGIWMLCMYASFTNRIAYLSWLLYPLVLLYPLLRIDLFNRQVTVLKSVIWGQLIVTIILAFIYS